MQRKFEPDREKQKHDADLGENFDRFELFDQSESVRSDDDSRQHQTDEQRQFLDRLEKGNPYQLDGSGLLYLPGVSAIPLAGLDADQATVRIQAETSLRPFTIIVTFLPLEPVGVDALAPFGYTLVYGVLNLINFAHSEVFISGAYAVVFTLTALGFGPSPLNFPWYELVGCLVAAAVAGMLVSAVVAFLLERLAYKPLRARNGSRLAFLITAIGNYALQEPTPAQLDAIADLMAWAVRRFDLSLDAIGGHYDYATTDCPGKNLRKYLEDGTFRRMVAARLR